MHEAAREAVEASDLESDVVDGANVGGFDGVFVVVADVGAGARDEARVDGARVVSLDPRDVVGDELELVLEGAVFRAVLGE